MKLDGLNFPIEFEKQLDSAFKTAFSDKPGEMVVDYLRRLTLDSTCMPGANTNEVLMREGARWVVGIILERIHRGRNPDVGSLGPTGRNANPHNYRLDSYFGNDGDKRKSA